VLVCAYAAADFSNRQKHALAYLSSKTEPKARQRITGCKQALMQSSRPMHSTITQERERKLAWDLYFIVIAEKDSLLLLCMDHFL